MRTLMLTKFVPTPADSGGKQRSLAVLQQFAERGEVTLFAFDDGNSDLSSISELGVDLYPHPLRPGSPKWQIERTLRARSWLAGRFWDPDLYANFRDCALAGSFDVICVEYSALAPYLLAVKDLPAIKIIDLHNVESVLVKRMAATKNPLVRPLYSVEAKAISRLEKSAIQAADIVSLVTETDRLRAEESARNMVTVVCANGCNPNSPLSAPTSSQVAVFVALMGWAPNADAAMWLARDVWPFVREQVPDAELRLVGKEPTDELKQLASTQDGVVVTGSVESVEPELAAATVCLAPLRAGGGSRLKILEALNAGRPVVATRVGAEGFEELEGSGIILADDPQEIASAIAKLMQDPGEAARLGALGNQAVRSKYAWNATLKPLFEEIEKLRA